MPKPHLTANVLDGLSYMASLVEAGGIEDVFGNDNAETRKQMEKVLKACKWIRSMQEKKRLEK